MRRAAGKRRDGSRGRAQRRVHRPKRSPGTARRRQSPLSGQRRIEGSRTRKQRNRPSPDRHRRFRTKLHRQSDDRTGRHRQQRPFGRKCHPGRFHGRRPRRSRRCRTAALPLPGRCRTNGHARADDERHQRRRARQQQPGHPGIHDYARRRADLPRSPALRRGSLPRPEKTVRCQRLPHHSRRRRRFRTQPEQPRRSFETDAAGRCRRGLQNR